VPAQSKQRSLVREKVCILNYLYIRHFSIFKNQYITVHNLGIDKKMFVADFNQEKL